MRCPFQSPKSPDAASHLQTDIAPSRLPHFEARRWSAVCSGMSATNGGLTPRQVRFCQEYAIDLNATAAARRAGYSEKTAEQQGSRLFRNVQVKARIAELQDEVAERIRDAMASGAASWRNA